jgi:hypothetical protein
MLLQQMVCREDHSRSADSALRSSALQETLLDRVQLLAFSRTAREPFNGSDDRSLSLQNGNQAGVHQLPVEQDRAGAALALAAAFLGAGQVEILAQYIEQTLDRRRAYSLLFVIDGELYVSHIAPEKCSDKVLIMRRKVIVKVLTAVLFGLLFGMYVHHGYLKWNARGQAAFLSYQNHRFVHVMAHPGPEFPLLLSCIILALLGAGLYELIVAGIFKLISPAR